MARKNFDKDFKLEAANLVVNQKRPVKAVVKELGIHEKHSTSGSTRPVKVKNMHPPVAVILVSKQQRCVS